ncbi:MAG: MBOAT family protein, partial [Coleofasciculaceae cyanobacterium]
MTFISLNYALFLLGVIGFFWLVRKPERRLWIVLIASLIFYASLQIQYIPLLILITILNFAIGKKLDSQTTLGPHAKNQNLSNEEWVLAQKSWNQKRFKILCWGITLNVVGLVGFKYLPFLLTNTGAVLNLQVGQGADWLKANLITPLGLSFFIFECIAYLIDVYRGAPATQKLLDFSAYKLFFPKLISGPITRYHQFAGGLKTLQFPSVERLTEGLWLLAYGAIKKAVLADRLGIFVDLCFGNLERAGSGDLWLAIFAYGLQLYLDFSGYVDMAR